MDAARQAILSAEWTHSVSQWLDQFSEQQGLLLTIFKHKRTALTAADVARIQALNNHEQVLVNRISALAHERLGLINAVRTVFPNVRTLGDAIRQGNLPDAASWLARIQAVESLTARVQHESWVLWVLTHRATQFYDDVIELIAHCGQRTANYGERDHQKMTGGAVLDTAA